MRCLSWRAGAIGDASRARPSATEGDLERQTVLISRVAVQEVPQTASGGEVATPSTQPLRHFSSQIKLDLSVLPIGTSKRNPNKLLPNIKPRKSTIKLPSLSENDEEPPTKLLKTDENRLNPVPSTSNLSPKSKALSTIAKIQGITNEIRNLSNLKKNIDGKLKRPLNLTGVDLDVNDYKKQKLDVKSLGCEGLSDSSKDICLWDVAKQKLE
ncbi:hypothetical protein K1T71_013966 [Dendrolimus kikuchii]|uniref:Uncharacterized protein n=1 Tax=Dendrolimus kikuchii TaxID=765133 RepID=A0ACC1CG82_9NEOP|nr:hypothetical protein K1T71_013966 [Dendrolimus kikuchii]